jgi:bifunctional DNA-binding transcriptional regulator/antitoxin component of YhaV-PrlF toxin-antitoxin module
MAKHSFEAEIEAARGGGAFVRIPFDVRATYGTGGQVRVKAEFDGEAYRGSIAPMGAARHVIGVPKAIRDALGKSIGDRVRVTLEKDDEPRAVTVPDDLAGALARDRTAGPAFEKLSYTHRKEYVRWVEEAKKPETRERRVARTLYMVKEGKSL